MKIWIDAQLSPSIASWVNRTFDDIEAESVRALGLRDATDSEIFEEAKKAKAVTGTLFARMVDDGLIDIDAPISNYVDDLPNPHWAQLTLRQHASQTAGIVGYEENYALNWRVSEATEDIPFRYNMAELNK